MHATAETARERNRKTNTVFNRRILVQCLWLTLGALALYIVVRRLPTGSDLSHMDFRPGAGSIELCDPSNPQFLPAMTVKSPVVMEVVSTIPAEAGQRVDMQCSLRTATGKPISEKDLLTVHTQKLHLLVIDPSLSDYQHIHPTETNEPGKWAFSFSPKKAGQYRIFADFAPAATGRGLYAVADISVGKGNGLAEPRIDRRSEQGIYHFSLITSGPEPRAGQPIDLEFSVEDTQGEAVPLQPIMGAFAHLVAFDESRSGFAHLHPQETDLTKAPDLRHPKLHFRVTMPAAGRYVIWSQINLAGQEMYYPFELLVRPRSE